MRYLLTLALVATGMVSSLSGQVRVYQEPLTLPTYRVMEPEIMPDWDVRRYPYPMLDRITNEKYNRTYSALWVENEYVKALVLPEIGGRLHGAQDKTNGYRFLYDQKVIKPGLIGLTGAWISGGVEWNFPDGHRASGFRDTDWRLVENPDGSKTAWVGEIDRITGMRWSIGTTVHPGRNWVETKVRLFNCTPYVHRFQYWATSAVRATHNYQAVIPGELMTGHAKHGYFHWPVNNGVDITYWKNIPGTSSFFAVESESDYFGGYSPEEQAGMVHVADHHIVRGKKLWTWGTAPAGRLWEKILTDGDLPYFEPQAGGYSDNQPDLHWIMPGETKIFSHFWFPTRDIGVFDFANLEGTLNLELKNGKAGFGWSPTGVNKDAVVILTCDNKEIFRHTVDADPATPFLGEVSIPREADLYQLRMTVLSSTGDTLLTFRHPAPTNPPLPEQAPPLPAPDKVDSQDRLFIIGEHYNKFRDPGRAKLYYQEALKRDNGDLRSNTAIGEMLLMDGLFAKALEYFEKSIERDPAFYKAWYFKGLAQLRLGDIRGAENSLNRSSYSPTWYAVAHFELAQLTASQNHLERALEHIERSIRSNGDNSQAYAVKALILNRLERHEEALKTALEIQIVDPMDFFSLAQRVMALKKSGAGKEEVNSSEKDMLGLTRHNSENHIELALRFARCGSYKEAAFILDMLTGESGITTVSPLVYYYQAYYMHLTGEEKESDALRKKGSEVSAKYCFPNRLESFPVLEWALARDPEDARAHYLLGSLYKSRSRSAEAVSQWEKSVAINPMNAVAFRNLGLAYHEKGDLRKAKESYLAALKANPAAGMAIVELGRLNREMKIPYEKQIALFEEYIDIVSGYDQALTQLIELYVLTGDYGDALKWLTTHHFKSWEGQYGIHRYWIQSNIKQGDIEFASGRYKKALEHYKFSVTYPDNLEVAEQPNTIHARKHFKIAMALEALGEKEPAHKNFRQVVADKIEPGNAYQFYRGQALEALGEKKQAIAVYEQMLAALDKQEAQQEHIEQLEVTDEAVRMHKAKALQLFSRSLALEGLGRTDEAEKVRKAALELDPLAPLNAFKPPRFGW